MSNMADASSTILFIIGLRRAGVENWVKYALLRVRMSLCICLCLMLMSKCLSVSENQALQPPAHLKPTLHLQWRTIDISLFNGFLSAGLFWLSSSNNACLWLVNRSWKVLSNFSVVRTRICSSTENCAWTEAHKRLKLVTVISLRCPCACEYSFSPALYKVFGTRKKQINDQWKWRTFAPRFRTRLKVWPNTFRRTLSRVPKLTSCISLYKEPLFSGHLY